MKNDELQELWRKAIMEIKVSTRNTYDPCELAPGPHKGKRMQLTDAFYTARVVLYEIYELINEPYDPNKIIEIMTKKEPATDEQKPDVDCREVSFTYFILTSLISRTGSSFDPSSYANRFSTARKYDNALLSTLINIFEDIQSTFCDTINEIQEEDPGNELLNHIKKQYMSANTDIQKLKDIHTW